MKLITKFWIGILILVILSPLGLLIPAYFKADSAWGEWGADQMRGLIGYIPSKLAKLSGFWNAPIPDYAFKGWEEKSLGHLSFAYVISAIIGIAIVVIVALLIGRILAKKGD